MNRDELVDNAYYWARDKRTLEIIVVYCDNAIRDYFQICGADDSFRFDEFEFLKRIDDYEDTNS